VNPVCKNNLNKKLFVEIWKGGRYLGIPKRMAKPKRGNKMEKRGIIQGIKRGKRTGTSGKLKRENHLKNRS